MKNAVIQFAKEQEYDGAEYSGKWKEFDVWEPIFEGDEPAIIGLPYVILVNGEKIRMSTEEEAFDYFDTLPDEKDAE